MVSALSQTTSPLLLPCGANSRERLLEGLSPELVEEEGKTACASSLPGSSPNMVQKRLALVVVLLEPGLELGGGDHQQRVKGLSQRRLKQNRCCINGRHHSENGVRWQQVQLFVCNPRELKMAIPPSATLTKARSLCSRIFNKPWEGERRHGSDTSKLDPVMGPWAPHLAISSSLSLYRPPSNTAALGGWHMLMHDPEMS